MIVRTLPEENILDRLSREAFGLKKIELSALNRTKRFK